MKRTAVFSASILVLSLAARAQTPAKVTFADHMLPIFRNACLNCHNPDKKKAGLDLTTYQGTLQGSENGKVVESGNPSGSLLFKCVKQTEEPKMPPKGDKLTDAELALVEKWIAGQLLETATGKAIAAASNNVQVAVVSLERPAGPPPMPGELPLEPVMRSSRQNSLTALGASPWAPLVAIGGQKQVILYNTDTLEPLGILPFPEGFPAIVRFSRNGQLLLTGGGLGGKSGKVVLWEIQSGDRIATVGNEVDQVLAADLSPDQQFIALGGPAKLVKIYATKDGRLVHSMKKHTDWVTALAYSPDGKFLASADRNGGIMVWEGSTGKEYNSLPGHKVMVADLAFMNGVVASASEDGKVVLWDVKESKELKGWEAHKGGVQSVDFTPDGRLVSSGRDKTARVWDQTGKQLMASEEFNDIALRAEVAGERVVAGDWTGEIRVWSLPDGKRVGELSSNPLSLKDRIAETTARLDQLQAAHPALEQALVAAPQKPKEAPAPQPVGSNVAELAKKIETLTAELAKRREDRGSKAPASPEYAEADAKVQQAKPELALAEAALLAAQKGAPPVLGKTSGEDGIVRATKARDMSLAGINAAKRELEKWKLAQRYMTVHQARELLTAKRAHYEELSAAAKDASLPVEKLRADLAASEKAAAEAPAKIAEKAALLAQAQQATETARKLVAGAEAALGNKEGALKALEKNAGTPADAAELTKKLAQQNAELAKLRELRAATAEATPEYTAANAKVQAQKAVVAETQTALTASQAPAKQGDQPEIKQAQSEIANAKEALESARASAKVSSEKALAAEQELTAMRKTAQEIAARVAAFRKELPETTKKAQLAKVGAERAAQLAAKELEAAKAEVEKRRAEYNAFRKGGEQVSPKVAAG